MEKLESIIFGLKAEVERLQGEIAEHERQLADGELVSKEWHDEQVLHAENEIAEQKAEIERLKKEHERIAWSKQEYLDWVHGFLSTHTDMKDRGEDYKMFDREWMCGVFWAKIEGSIEYIIDLENQRNELQKQVDELNERYLEESKERCEFEQKYKKIQHAHNIGLGAQRSHWEKKVEQAVKDTAKEILEQVRFLIEERNCVGGYDLEDETIDGTIFVEVLNELKERYGVEVE